MRTKPGNIVVKKETQVYSPKRGDVESENNIGKILKFRYIDSERARGRQSGRLLHRANRLVLVKSYILVYNMVFQNLRGGSSSGCFALQTKVKKN